jgi:hypothetical protein
MPFKRKEGTEPTPKVYRQHVIETPRTIGAPAPRGPKSGVKPAGEAPPPLTSVEPRPIAPVKPVKEPVVGPMAPRSRTRPDSRKPDPAEGYRVPKEQEVELRKEARRQFPHDRERQDAFVYGTMRRQGWKPDHNSPWDGRSYKHWYWGRTKV